MSHREAQIIIGMLGIWGYFIWSRLGDILYELKRANPAKDAEKG